jgi:hypothetical protein
MALAGNGGVADSTVVTVSRLDDHLGAGFHLPEDRSPSCVILHALTRGFLQNSTALESVFPGDAF